MKIVRLKLKVDNEELKELTKLSDEMKETMIVDASHDFYMLHLVDVSNRLYLAFQKNKKQIEG